MLIVPVLLPILAGAFVYFYRDRWPREARNIFSLAVMLVNAALTVWLCLTPGRTLTLWYLTPSLPIYFRIDEAGAWFACLIALVWTAAGIFSFRYMERQHREHSFYACYLMTLGVLIGLCFSGNLATFYMCYELMTLASLPLVLHEGTREAVAAGIKYLIYSVCGAALALLGMFFLYRQYPSLEFTAGGAFSDGAPLVWVLLMLIGFGAKAGMFPLHGWLPTAHPVAPAPASAVLSGVITKAGVLGCLRVVYYVVGADQLRGTYVQYTWMALAAFTVFMGSMLALKEQVLKKRLAYSTVSQVSYVLLGLSAMDASGVAGALLHVIFHSVIKNCLFLCAGAIIFETGFTRVDELRGVGKRMPVALWAFTVASLALVGVPPASGFVSKWYIATGAMEIGGALYYIAPIALLLSAILTAGYLMPISIRGFFPGGGEYAACEPKPSMLGPVALLGALALLMGVFASPLCDAALAIARAALG